ncbi:MAG: hypothetical protein QM610_15310 [Chitinophagaceae bacterium]
METNDFLPNRTILLTEDGSPSIAVPKYNITYHNVHGALLESQTVYLQNGLQYATTTHSTLSILEMGLETGLNAMLSWHFAKNKHKTIQYNTLVLNYFPWKKNCGNPIWKTTAFLLAKKRC